MSVPIMRVLYRLAPRSCVPAGPQAARGHSDMTLRDAKKTCRQYCGRQPLSPTLETRAHHRQTQTKPGRGCRPATFVLPSAPWGRVSLPPSRCKNCAVQHRLPKDGLESSGSSRFRISGHPDSSSPVGGWTSLCRCACFLPSFCRVEKGSRFV